VHDASGMACSQAFYHLHPALSHIMLFLPKTDCSRGPAHSNCACSSTASAL
jgi:hypothetical protein